MAWLTQSLFASVYYKVVLSVGGGLEWVLRIYSFIPAISVAPLQVHYYSEALQTIQHGYCIGVSRQSAQAITGKGLKVQGPYVMARAGVELTTLRETVL